MRSTRRALLLVLALSPVVAHAGPFTREQGGFYLGLSYARLSTDKLYAPDFKRVSIAPYQQHLVGLYAEIGVASWLTATLDANLLRENQLDRQGATLGLGDWRLGILVPLLKQPAHLTFAATLGIPLGDASPSAGAHATPDAQAVARSLPTGDGEWDLDLRVTFGHTFGGARRWPLRHYLVLEAGYWTRTRFQSSFVWRFELGTKLPWHVVDRFWLAVRLGGVESFASNKQAALTATGLGDGVTYVSPGVLLYARVWRGLGASVAWDTVVRGRSIATGSQLTVGVSYTR